MDILLIVFAFLLLVASIVGCILPMLPGVPLAYAGMLLLHLTDKVHFTTHQLIIWLIVVIVLQVVDYITPLLGSKYSGGTSFGNRGCMAGTILGLFFIYVTDDMPWLRLSQCLARRKDVVRFCPVHTSHALCLPAR